MIIPRGGHASGFYYYILLKIAARLRNKVFF